MITKFIKVLTTDGIMTLNKMNIVSIDPITEGTRIVMIPLPYSEDPVTVESTDNYEQVLELYFSG